MRTSEIKFGETYLVRVPHRLPSLGYPEQRHKHRDRDHLWGWFGLQILRGQQFHLTVTDVDTEDGRVWVQGFRVLDASRAEVTLTDEQADSLGLPSGGRYRICGSVSDSEDRMVKLPHVLEMRVPARWLAPQDTVDGGFRWGPF